VRWPAFGGLFHLCRIISKAFREKRHFNNELQEILFPITTRCQKLHGTKLAQSGTKTLEQNLLRSSVKWGAMPTPRFGAALLSGSNGSPLRAIKSYPAILFEWPRQNSSYRDSRLVRTLMRCSDYLTYLIFKGS
jgi:hypothetical protein